MSNTANGGGYGNPGQAAQSAQQAHAQAMDATNPTPSEQMAQEFDSQPSDVMQAAVTGEGMGLHNQTEAHRSQSQIAYDAEEE